MDLQHNTQTATICPYCARPVSRYSGNMDCPHCGRTIFGVPCPKCGRPTLNLTLIVRYGKATCFGCQAVVDHLPSDAPVAVTPPPPSPVQKKQAAARKSEQTSIEPIMHPTISPRAPKNPIMPTAAEALAVVEKSLVGLERVAQDREMLRAPDLRAIINQYLDTLQAVLDLDSAMENGTVNDEWLRADASHLDAVARFCYAPLWPMEGALLQPSAQAWVLVIDDAARRWQYARRRWLEEQCGLTMMPTVAEVTTTNPTWHEITGDGPVITEVVRPGFFLRGEIIRKAIVRA